jgi:hypothetical protein
VKVVTLRGVDGAEARVSKSGSFLISGLPDAAYLLTLMQGEAILYQSAVKAYPAGSRLKTGNCSGLE